MIEPFLSALPILNTLEKAGFTAYFVGGSVRDFILNRPIHDVDIATSATPIEMKKIFPKTIDIGIEHGTLLILYRGSSYEVTTYRAEKEYVDFRRPKEVIFIRSLNDDLERRDFTINAMAMDKNGNLIDPFGGQLAIMERKIETVGNAEARFSEDALRMMRALRFLSQLSFSIEAKTLEALSKNAYLLEKIAVERKRAEFEKLLIGSNRTQALYYILETNLFQFLPSLENKKNQIQTILDYDCSQLNLNEMWALFIFCLGCKDKQVEHFMREWKMPVQQIKKVKKILHFLYNRLLQEWSTYDLYLATEEVISSVEKLYLTLNEMKDFSSISTYVSLYRTLPLQHRSEMSVSGNDLIEWFRQDGGPWLNETLVNIERAILDGYVKNEKSKIKEWLEECKQI